MVENLEDFLGSGLVDLPVGEVSKSDVKNGSILGGVDVLAGEHVVSVLLDAWEETRQGRRARRKWRRRRPMRSAFLRRKDGKGSAWVCEVEVEMMRRARR